MHRLITTAQETKLNQMLDDQNVSIENIEIDFEEVKPSPNKPTQTDAKLFRPFENNPRLGIKKMTDDFNDWADFYLSKPNKMF